MDRIYRHFRAKRSFPEPSWQVCEAARAFVDETLQWPTADAPGGFDAKGTLAGHDVLARFRVGKTREDGTKLRIELLATRSGIFGSPGYLLLDPFGRFRRPIRKWLQAIRNRLDGLPDLAVVMTGTRGRPRGPIATLCLYVVGGFVVTYAAYLYLMLVIALFTGNLYVWARYRSDGEWIHGMWARIAAAMLLAFPLTIFLLAWWQKRKARRLDGRGQ